MGAGLGRVMVECTLSITHCLRPNLQLHTIDLVRTCRISSFCTVASQLARFQLTRRIARSLGDSWASCMSRFWQFDSMTIYNCLQCLTLLGGWQEGHPTCKKTEWWGGGVVIWLQRGADLHIAQLMPLQLYCVEWGVKLYSNQPTATATHCLLLQ